MEKLSTLSTLALAFLVISIRRLFDPELQSFQNRLNRSSRWQPRWPSARGCFQDILLARPIARGSSRRPSDKQKCVSQALRILDLRAQGHHRKLGRDTWKGWRLLEQTVERIEAEGEQRLRHDVGLEEEGEPIFGFARHLGRPLLHDNGQKHFLPGIKTIKRFCHNIIIFYAQFKLVTNLQPIISNANCLMQI